MNKETGGAAFPVTGSEHNHPIDGMTLRDYFAAKAMEAMLSNEAELQRIRTAYYTKDHLPAISGMAYRLADAMIEARNK